MMRGGKSLEMMTPGRNVSTSLNCGDKKKPGYFGFYSDFVLYRNFNEP